MEGVHAGARQHIFWHKGKEKPHFTPLLRTCVQMTEGPPPRILEFTYVCVLERKFIKKKLCKY
jgi:hypothetical protein